MSILDTTIVNVALRSLSRDLGAPLSSVQWVSTGYLLSLAMVIPLAGWMSERFGAKRIWLVSVTLFGLGSALCGVAGSVEVLIGFRVLQGFGGGMIMPVAMTMLAQTAGPQRIGRVMSVAGVPLLLAPILGPVIGGLIVDNTTWRWIFYVNLPVAVVALVLAVRLLPSATSRADAGPLDWVGLGLLSPGLAGIVFGLSEVESQGGITGPEAFGPILAGLLLTALFVVHALRHERPLIDVGLFRSRSFSAAAATTFALGGALFGTMLVLPLYYQVVRGESALIAGLLMAPQGLGAAVSLTSAGRLVDRVGGGHVALVGCVIMTLATVPLAGAGANTPLVVLGCLLFVRGLGLGAAMMPALSAAYARLAGAQVPGAASALNTLQRVGGSIGTALLAVILQGRLRSAAATPDTVASAFAHTFVWATALSLLAVLAAGLLARAEGTARDAGPRRAELRAHAHGAAI
ncbi:MAG: hypothetical protein QOH46_4124 [Solirubrobacteraceae bacterium]|nr:hypothetical protein [Solirubrobacteraceae bacterium]